VRERKIVEGNKYVQIHHKHTIMIFTTTATMTSQPILIKISGYRNHYCLLVYITHDSMQPQSIDKKANLNKS